jgi:N-acetylglutamate synthase-like GNAT family acetyltransferase
MILEDLTKLNFPAASTEQSEEITALVNSVYRGDNSRKGWTTEADFLDGIRITEEKVAEIVSAENNVIILAVLDSKIIGCVHLEKKGDYCWLGLLSVDVNCQTYGIGRMLIQTCETFAREKFACNEMKMKVVGIRTELIEYYKRRGYQLTGEREDFKASRDTFGEPKTRKLYFEVLRKRL